ncbi:hypothetical protein [Leptospira langatensis]|uniref:hypothetical protein n=1 Tax=Leptospira langatensis TaxID=2484983 RepID=UPI0014383E9C|nr:hypothetical protein [Leptospira langatensis]
MHRKITYKIVDTQEPLNQDAFDALGALGFELISVIHNQKNDYFIYHFKQVEANH